VILFYPPQIATRKNNGRNNRRRREGNAESTAQPGRRIETAWRTSRGQLLRAHQAQSEPVSGHYGRAVVHGVPVPRAVCCRPGGVPADRPVRVRARDVRAA